LWELGPQSADYFFFDENCSYHLLPLIELAVSPPQKLRDAFHFMAIPSDTLAAAVKAVGNTHVSLRPSLSNILKYRLSKLNSEEKQNFYSLLEDPLRATTQTSPHVVDAVLDGLRMKKNSRTSQISYDSSNAENHLLTLRAAMPITPQPPPTIEAEPWPKGSSPPHLGHRSSKRGVAFGVESDSQSQIKITDLKFRPAFHDEIDPSEGHLPFSSLNIARTTVRVRWEERPQIFLQELTLAEVKSLGPPDLLASPTVWQIWGGFRQPLDLLCRECGVGQIHGGWGLSQNFGLSYWNWMVIVNGTFEVGNVFASNFRWAPSLQAIGLLELPSFRLFASSELFWFYSREGIAHEVWVHEIKTSLFQVRDLDLRAGYTAAIFPAGQRQQFLLEAQWYY
ncbi:MAG: DUF4105 domain-containing protein, partial [Bdellovibrionales bacterium]|nr:DUF4105 domain-containing protein [Bdellovibrionales bacterium]